MKLEFFYHIIVNQPICVYVVYYRYYTGHCLAQELLKQNIQTTGTVMRNRQGLPCEVKRKFKMQKYEVRVWNYNDNEMILTWQDKRIIFMPSTYFTAATE